MSSIEADIRNKLEFSKKLKYSLAKTKNKLDQIKDL
jgi:hypothetical protein